MRSHPSRRLFLLLVAAVAVASAAKLPPSGDTPSSRRRSPLRDRLRRSMPAAFQCSERIHELSLEESAAGKPYLIQFKGKGDDYCKQMEPLKEQLRDELGLEIRCFEVWYDSKNLELLQRLDRGRCGGVPFFYNKRSRRFVCGATTYANLKAWALCQPCEPFLPPPNINADKEPEPNQVQKFFGKIKTMAEEKMAGRGDDDDDDEDDDED